jgi:hypothetical protein
MSKSVRREDGSQHQRFPRHSAGEKKRDTETEQQFEVHHDRNHDHGVDESAPEIRVAQDMGIVGEANESGAASERRLVEAEPEHPKGGDEDHHRHQNLNRSDQSESRPEPLILRGDHQPSRCAKSTSRSRVTPRPGPAGTVTQPFTS